MKNRSELREVIVKVIYQTIILEEAKLEYNVNDLIKEQLEVQNEFVDSCVHGILENKEGRLINKLLKLDNKKVLIDTKNGKEAILDYKVIKEKNNLSLIDISLITGRYHQIRIQFSHIGHPLLGDSLYTNKNEGNIKLMCYSLTFTHPTLKKQMTFEIKNAFNL